MQQKHYTVSNDYTIFESLFPIPEMLRDELQLVQNKLYNDKNTSVFAKLTRLQKKHPNNPHLLCDIATYYAVRKNYKKAIELYQQVIDKHKGYTFAYINLAQTFIDEDKFDAAAQVLGENLQIENLFPERKEFHIDEIKSYLNVCFSFYLFQGNIEQAGIIVDEFAALDPYDERIETYRHILSFSEFATEIENGNGYSDYAYDDEDIDIPELPKFQVNLIEDLFELGGDIPMDFIDKILEQDRVSLIVDLELVLDYAREHSEFFMNNIRHEERNTFVLHAFIILGELKAKESIDKCIAFFTLDLEIIDYWLGDHKSETFWQIFYKFDIDPFFLKDYILNNYIKQPYFSYIADTLLCNTALLKPETKFQVAVIYKELLEHIDSLNRDNDFIDDEFNGTLIASCLDLNLQNLLPLIKKLYKDDKVDEMICGNMEDIKYEVSLNKGAIVPELLSIADIYSYFEDRNNLFDENDEDDFDFYDEFNDFFGDEPEIKNTYHGRSQLMPPSDKIIQPKVGRNDPCPCGSGKKFKKCCMDR